MQTTIRMCDARLAEHVDVYGHWPVPMENISTFAPGLIAFNLSGTRIEVDGERRAEPVLFGVANDPNFVRYSISGGSIVSLRVNGGAYDQLFHIDPSVERGIIALDRNRHPKIDLFTVVGMNCHKCEATTKAIAEHAGREHGHKMKILADQGTETLMEEPQCPNQGTEQAKVG